MIDKNSSPSDSELVGAIRKGDEDAKTNLVNKHNGPLNQWVGNYLRGKHCNQPAEHLKGVINSTWIKVFSHLHALQEIAKFDHWLNKIAYNEANHHLRWCIRSQSSSVQFIDDSLLPSAQIVTYYSSRDSAMDVDRMLSYADTLPGEFGSIFRMHHEQDLSFSEIATTLGKKEETIRTQYYRGLRKVKERFK